MIEILNKLNDTKKSDSYQMIRESLKEGIINNAITSDGHISKILHGWGHNKDYFVGSFNDPDHVSRDSLTSNAFYVISNMIKNTPNL